MSKQNNTTKRFAPKLIVKKGDTVQVLSGNDKGTQGRVLEVLPLKGKAIVEGVNIIKRHTKPNAANPDGGIIEKEAPIQISNLTLLDPKSGKPTRIGRKKDSNGKTVRYAKKSGEVID